MVAPETRRSAHQLTACCRLRAACRGTPSQPAGNARDACGDSGTLCGILRYDRPGWPVRQHNHVTRHLDAAALKCCWPETHTM